MPIQYTYSPTLASVIAFRDSYNNITFVMLMLLEDQDRMNTQLEN